MRFSFLHPLLCILQKKRIFVQHGLIGSMLVLGLAFAPPVFADAASPIQMLPPTCPTANANDPESLLQWRNDGSTVLGCATGVTTDSNGNLTVSGTPANPATGSPAVPGNIIATGGVKTGTVTANCSAGIAGMMRYYQDPSQPTGTLQYCNGQGWVSAFAQTPCSYAVYGYNIGGNTSQLILIDSNGDNAPALPIQSMSSGSGFNTPLYGQTAITDPTPYTGYVMCMNGSWYIAQTGGHYNVVGQYTGDAMPWNVPQLIRNTVTIQNGDL